MEYDNYSLGHVALEEPGLPILRQQSSREDRVDGSNVGMINWSINNTV